MRGLVFVSYSMTCVFFSFLFWPSNEDRALFSHLVHLTWTLSVHTHTHNVLRGGVPNPKRGKWSHNPILQTQSEQRQSLKPVCPLFVPHPPPLHHSPDRNLALTKKWCNPVLPPKWPRHLSLALSLPPYISCKISKSKTKDILRARQYTNRERQAQREGRQQVRQRVLEGGCPVFLLGLFDAIWFVDSQAVDRTNKKRR